MEERGLGKVGTVLLIAVIISILVTGLTIVLGGEKILKISGSTTVRPLAKRWRNEFIKENSEIRISVKGGGSGKGVADVKGGLADIGMSSSKSLITQEVDLDLHLMAYDAILIIVNKENPVLDTLEKNGIDNSTLQKIYSEKITNWNKIPGINRDHRIYNYTRSDASGSAEIFAKFLGMTQDGLRGTGAKGNAGTKEAISNNEWGIGYVGAKYAFDNSIEVIPLDGNNDGKISDYERIDNFNDLKSDIENYPIGRGLYFATKGKPTEAVKKFIEWCKDEGQTYVSDVGYVPISGA